MTVVDDRQATGWARENVRSPGAGNRSGVHWGPSSARPPVAPLLYRGGGVRMSQMSHGHRAVSTPVSTPVSIALAVSAALVTLWLGFLGHFSGERSAPPAPLSNQLAVVHVQSGETLQQLAARVAPQRPAEHVVQRIRELNKLGSASVDAGQTLIAPVG